MENFYLEPIVLFGLTLIALLVGWRIAADINRTESQPQMQFWGAGPIAGFRMFQMHAKLFPKSWLRKSFVLTAFAFWTFYGLMHHRR